jgi:gamma-glutamylcyclotransferase (GGCT)/AIG2-like uncharacterized protein YtfP
MNHLFSYGTLSDSAFMRRLLGRDYKHRAASLPGYKKIAIHGFDYPAIVPQANSHVDGIVHFDLPPTAWATLDTYEGPTYTRRIVIVKFDTGESLESQAYVWNA